MNVWMLKHSGEGFGETIRLFAEDRPPSTSTILEFVKEVEAVDCSGRNLVPEQIAQEVSDKGGWSGSYEGISLTLEKVVS